jgi:hypothetical protein
MFISNLEIPPKSNTVATDYGAGWNISIKPKRLTLTNTLAYYESVK